MSNGKSNLVKLNAALIALAFAGFANAQTPSAPPTEAAPQVAPPSAPNGTAKQDHAALQELRAKRQADKEQIKDLKEKMKNDKASGAPPEQIAQDKAALKSAREARKADNAAVHSAREKLRSDKAAGKH